MQKTWIRSLGREDPWRRKWQVTPVFLPGKTHGQSSLVDYSPWGYKRVRHHLPTKQRQILISLPSAFTKNSNKTLKCVYFLSYNYKLCRCWNTMASLPYAKHVCISLKSSLNFSFLHFLLILWHYFCKIKPMGKKKVYWVPLWQEACCSRKNLLTQSLPENRQAFNSLVKLLAFPS